jgi:trans-2-enoyl-CoA reductase
VSACFNGKYAEPENPGPPINSDLDEFESYIPSDQTFSSSWRTIASDVATSTLYINQGSWTKSAPHPANIKSATNEFSANGLDDYEIDIDALQLKRMR